MLKYVSIVNQDFIFDEVYVFENNNLTNIAFPLKDKNIDIERLAMFRLRIREDFGAMWLSDYIDNGYIKEIKI